MKHFMAAAGLALMLAACSGPDTVAPGQWTTAMQVTEVKMPGLPDAAAADMREARVASICIRSRMAANPVGFLLNPDNRGRCQFTDSSTFADGVISLQGTCYDYSGQREDAAVSVEGRFTTRTIEGRFTMGPPTNRISGTITARRVGDCPNG